MTTRTDISTRSGLVHVNTTQLLSVFAQVSESEMSDKNRESYQDQINEQMEEGGGCAETWQALSEMRGRASDTSNRRSFLGKAVTGVGVGFGSLYGFSSIASAQDGDKSSVSKMKKARDKYNDAKVVRNELWSHSNDLLDACAEYGYSREEVISGAAMEEILTMEEYSQSRTGTVVYGGLAGDAGVTEIRSTATVEDGLLTLAVLPQTDYRYAVAKPDGASPSEYTVIKPELPNRTVTTESASTQSVSTQDVGISGHFCFWTCGPGFCPECVSYLIQCGSNGSCTVLESGTDWGCYCCRPVTDTECVVPPCNPGPCP